MAVNAGRDVFVKIDTTSTGGAGATWVTIGQQRGTSMSRSSETADGTNKDDNGWPDAIVTQTPWGMSCDGALNPSDTALATILTAWEAKTKVWVQYNENDISGEYVEGECLITTLDKEAPMNDVVTFTMEFQGASSLVTSVVYS